MAEPDLSGRRALVTGGARGIGATVAGALAGAGAAVVLCSDASRFMTGAGLPIGGGMGM